MTTNSYATTLKQASDAHAEILSAIERISSLIDAKSTKQVDFSRLETARLHVEDISALHLLGEATEEDLNKARIALDDAESFFKENEKLNQSSAFELSGLNRRLESAKNQEIAIKESLVAEEIIWCEEELKLAELAYLEHAQAVQENYLRVMACSAAINRRGGDNGSNTRAFTQILLPVIGKLSILATPNLRQEDFERCIFKESSPVSNFGKVNIEAEIESISKKTERKVASFIAKIGDKLGVTSATK